MRTYLLNTLLQTVSENRLLFEGDKPGEKLASSPGNKPESAQESPDALKAKIKEKIKKLKAIIAEIQGAPAGTYTESLLKKLDLDGSATKIKNIEEWLDTVSSPTPEAVEQLKGLNDKLDRSLLKFTTGNPENQNSTAKKAYDIMKAKDGSIDFTVEDLQKVLGLYSSGKYENSEEQDKSQAIMKAILENKEALNAAGILIGFTGGTDGTDHQLRKSAEYHAHKAKALHQLLAFYDDNKLTITEGEIDLAKNSDTRKLIETYISTDADKRYDFVKEHRAEFLPAGKIFDAALAVERAENRKQLLTGDATETFRVADDGQLDLAEPGLVIELGSDKDTKTERNSGITLSEVKKPAEATEPQPPKPGYLIEEEGKKLTITPPPTNPNEHPVPKIYTLVQTPIPGRLVPGENGKPPKIDVETGTLIELTLDPKIGAPIGTDPEMRYLIQIIRPADTTPGTITVTEFKGKYSTPEFRKEIKKGAPNATYQEIEDATVFFFTSGNYGRSTDEAFANPEFKKAVITRLTNPAEAPAPVAPSPTPEASADYTYELNGNILTFNTTKGPEQYTIKAPKGAILSPDHSEDGTDNYISVTINGATAVFDFNPQDDGNFSYGDPTNSYNISCDYATKTISITLKTPQPSPTPAPSENTPEAPIDYTYQPSEDGTKLTFNTQKGLEEYTIKKPDGAILTPVNDGEDNYIVIEFNKAKAIFDFDPKNGAFATTSVEGKEDLRKTCDITCDLSTKTISITLKAQPASSEHPNDDEEEKADRAYYQSKNIPYMTYKEAFATGNLSEDRNGTVSPKDGYNWQVRLDDVKTKHGGHKNYAVIKLDTPNTPASVEVKPLSVSQISEVAKSIARVPLNDAKAILNRASPDHDGKVKIDDLVNLYNKNPKDLAHGYENGSIAYLVANFTAIETADPNYSTPDGIMAPSDLDAAAHGTNFIEIKKAPEAPKPSESRPPEEIPTATACGYKHEGGKYIVTHLEKGKEVSQQYDFTNNTIMGVEIIIMNDATGRRWLSVETYANTVQQATIEFRPSNGIPNVINMLYSPYEVTVIGAMIEFKKVEAAPKPPAASDNPPAEPVQVVGQSAPDYDKAYEKWKNDVLGPWQNAQIEKNKSAVTKFETPAPTDEGSDKIIKEKIGNLFAFINQPGIRIVDISAIDCPACKRLKPFIYQLAGEGLSHGSYQAKFANFNMNSLDDSRGNFHLMKLTENISMYPTMLIYKDGKLIARCEGAEENKTELKKVIEKLLATSDQNPEGVIDLKYINLSARIQSGDIRKLAEGPDYSGNASMRIYLSEHTTGWEKIYPTALGLEKTKELVRYQMSGGSYRYFTEDGQELNIGERPGYSHSANQEMKIAELLQDFPFGKYFSKSPRGIVPKYELDSNLWKVSFEYSAAVKREKDIHGSLHSEANRLIYEYTHNGLALKNPAMISNVNAQIRGVDNAIFFRAEMLK